MTSRSTSEQPQVPHAEQAGPPRQGSSTSWEAAISECRTGATRWVRIGDAASSASEVAGERRKTLTRPHPQLDDTRGA